MQSLLKQQLRRPIDAREASGETESRSKKRSKQDAPYANKEGGAAEVWLRALEQAAYPAAAST